MALLFDWRGEDVPITEEVVKAAAGNEGNGKEVKPRTTVHMVIAQHHRHVSSALTRAAFCGIRKLRAGNAKWFISRIWLDVLYLLGSWRAGYCVTYRELRIGEWEEHLRKLERIRKAAEGNHRGLMGEVGKHAGILRSCCCCCCCCLAGCVLSRPGDYHSSSV